MKTPIAIHDLLKPVEPAESGIRMESLGNWSCAKLGLRGFRSLQTLKNAMVKKKAKLVR